MIRCLFALSYLAVSGPRSVDAPLLILKREDARDHSHRYLPRPYHASGLFLRSCKTDGDMFEVWGKYLELALRSG